MDDSGFAFLEGFFADDTCPHCKVDLTKVTDVWAYCQQCGTSRYFDNDKPLFRVVDAKMREITLKLGFLARVDKYYKDDLYTIQRCCLDLTRDHQTDDKLVNEFINGVCAIVNEFTDANVLLCIRRCERLAAASNIRGKLKALLKEYEPCPKCGTLSRKTQSLLFCERCSALMYWCPGHPIDWHADQRLFELHKLIMELLLNYPQHEKQICSIYNGCIGSARFIWKYKKTDQLSDIANAVVNDVCAAVKAFSGGSVFTLIDKCEQINKLGYYRLKNLLPLVVDLASKPFLKPSVPQTRTV